MPRQLSPNIELELEKVRREQQRQTREIINNLREMDSQNKRIIEAGGDRSSQFGQSQPSPNESQEIGRALKLVPK